MLVTCQILKIFPGRFHFPKANLLINFLNLLQITSMALIACHLSNSKNHFRSISFFQSKSAIKFLNLLQKTAMALITRHLSNSIILSQAISFSQSQSAFKFSSIFFKKLQWLLLLVSFQKFYKSFQGDFIFPKQVSF